MQTLGLRQAFDAGDLDYPMRPAASQRTSRHWPSPGVLDQLNTPQCVGFSTHKYLTSSPVINKPAFSPEWLYLQAQRLDEWPGEDYEGTSIRAAAKVLLREGYITEYNWGQTLDQIISHLFAHGPVLFCSPWTPWMSQPKHGFVFPSPGEHLDEADWHAYLLIGASDVKRTPWDEVGAARAINSWGANWSERGRFWLAYSTIQALLAAGAYAMIMKEIKR